tara:strand:+ start:1156 stop:1644 length:489 start_codon:yes stop_codon:yes gene_type:complete
MSYNTHRTWFYELAGRNINLWQMAASGNIDTVGGYKIRLPGSIYDTQLIYPDEDITSGLRFEGTAFIEPFVDNDPNALSGNDNPTLTEDTSPDADAESRHVNLSRMLSLAVVDYLRAHVAEAKGEIELKEYYMRSFWKKVGDEESNKRNVSMTFPVSPFAVR